MTQQAPHEGMIRDESGGLVVWRWPEYVPPPKTPAEIAMETIEQLERESLMNRITRESIMTMAKERAAAMGMTEAQLIAKNKGYAALKALDDEIAALRAQL